MGIKRRNFLKGILGGGAAAAAGVIGAKASGIANAAETVEKVVEKKATTEVEKIQPFAKFMETKRLESVEELNKKLVDSLKETKLEPPKEIDFKSIINAPTIDRKLVTPPGRQEGKTELAYGLSSEEQFGPYDQVDPDLSTHHYFQASRWNKDFNCDRREDRFKPELHSGDFVREDPYFYSQRRTYLAQSFSERDF